VGAAPGATRQQLPRTVIVLGCVSLLNDSASEMITPLLPVLLTATLGAGPAVVGLVEGVAEATASVLKLVAGRLVDRGAGAKRLVFAGYGLANVARPAIGLAALWPVVLLLRFADRVGKGIRTAPRDALIAGAAGEAIRGRAFGFHRSMDHAGAVLGPLLAYGLLTVGVPLGRVFLWSVIPGILVMLLLGFGVPADSPLAAVDPPPTLRWRALDTRLRALLVAAGALALATVPEVFVVLWARESGLPLAWVPLIWAAASLGKMLLAYPAGIATDALGRVPVLLAGWTLRVLALAALAGVAARGPLIWALFLAYSATLAATEPAERSLIGDVAPAGVRGTAFGLYHLAGGLLVLPGAVLFGVVWEHAGSGVAFGVAAAITALAAAGMGLAARAGGTTAA
jgi:MFS family permease